MAKEKKTYTGTGKRKTSVARVTLTPGTGKITVNGRDVNEYFPYPTLVMDLTQPLDATNTREIFDVEVKVEGGGFSGQAGVLEWSGYSAEHASDQNLRHGGRKYSCPGGRPGPAGCFVDYQL